MNAHIFQGPEGNKGEKGEPVCAAIKKHKHDFIFILFLVNISRAGHALLAHNRISVFLVLLSSDKLKSMSHCINISFSAGKAGTTGRHSSEFYSLYWYYNQAI